MKKSTSLIYLVLGLMIVIALIIWLSPSKAEKTKYDSFAQCLTDVGVKMYGTDWCHFCQDQKSRFGKSFKYVDYVNCDFNQEECNAAGVEGYPTWVINGETYSGVQPLESLASLTDCELPLE